jgi:hypothetical protein
MVGRAVTLDAGGIAVDASRGGSLRLKPSGAGYASWSLGEKGLMVGPVPISGDDPPGSDLSITLGDDAKATAGYAAYLELRGGAAGATGSKLQLEGPDSGTHGAMNLESLTGSLSQFAASGGSVNPRLLNVAAGIAFGAFGALKLGTIETKTLTGTTQDLDVSVNTTRVLLSGTANTLYKLSSIKHQHANADDGRVIVVTNDTDNVVFQLENLGAATDSTDKFLCPNQYDFLLFPRESVWMVRRAGSSWFVRQVWAEHATELEHGRDGSHPVRRDAGVDGLRDQPPQPGLEQ